MRLLFIYFYNEKGTFKKDTIISFSKKYFIEQDKDNKLTFKLIRNKNYDNKFYSTNSDIGVIIGENGTGKSILINSIRDKHNDYSIIIYENENEIFSYLGGKKEVTIGENIIENNRNFEHIYYSSIFDIFENETNDKYNISNIALHQKFEQGTDSLCMSNCTRDRLFSIENEDLKKYFNYNRTKNEKVNINYLKLNPTNNFFNKFEKEVLKYNVLLYDEIFNIEISHSSLNIDFFKYVIDNLSDGKITKIINELFQSNTEIYHEITDNNSKLSLFLSKDYDICKKYFIHLDRYVIKRQIIKKEIYQFEQYIKDSYLKNNNSKFNEVFIPKDMHIYI
ncbi:MAG: hypothetical protein COA39_003110 [Sulfurimonas sp.]|nr:hypothetical protein [Sulfurimonas sp.]